MHYPDLVVRPSGVWDSRSPFHDFLQNHRAANRSYFVLLLALARIRHLGERMDAAKPAKQLFKKGETGLLAGRSWQSYKRSYPKVVAEQQPPITVAQALDDLIKTTPDVTEFALLNYSSMFETYAQCWALNSLLARLEAGKPFTRAERRLAETFSPIFPERQTPSLLQIADAMPALIERLSCLPNIGVHPSTGEELVLPLSNSLNAWRTIRFWRDYRNLLVHSSGMVSLKFIMRNADFIEDFAQHFPYVPQIVRGRRIPVTDGTFRTMVATHYKAARSMNEVLEEAAAERRGHPWSPGPKPESVTPSDVPERSPRMLLPGDHEASLGWTTDSEFRRALTMRLNPTAVAAVLGT